VWCPARCGGTEGELTTAGRYSALGGLIMMVCTGNLRSLALLP
jgi:hypothetical protein